MIKQFKWILYAVLLGVGLSFCSSSDKQTEKGQAKILATKAALEMVHFSPMPIDDNYSLKVFDLYLKRLDYNKRFLTKEDYDKLSAYKTRIDDEVNMGSLNFFQESFQIINQRTKEVQEYYKEILSKPFTFDDNEEYIFDSKKQDYPKDLSELKDRWRKYMKHQTLIRVVEMLETQEKAKEKNDTTVKQRTFEAIEKDARGKVLKVHDEWFDRLLKLDSDERLALYVNAISTVFDTHTEYYPPKDKENFDIAMSGQLEGIGAQLQEKEGTIKVTNIVPGSPSYRQGQLKAGDLIIKVAQGDAEPVDIAGMKIDNAVQLIRGKKGTIVKLTVRKPDGTVLIIPIKRDVVVLEETFAQSAIINYNGKRIGFIKLPTFYADFNKRDGRSSAEDVKQEVIKLKEEKVDGIVIDLRNNGGGSLDDVVRMGGIFIDKGPIVQVKSRNMPPMILEDKDPSIIYDGPLAIMVNNNSASASEILAAAMQDYKRAVIIGTKSTFGKGTVQRFYNLDDVIDADNSIKPLGSIKITMQKFYRINGGSTQLKGVIPDIILPDPYSEIELGEKESDAPLPYDEIPKANYNLWKMYGINLSQAKKNSDARISKDSRFKLVSEQANQFKKQKDDVTINLNMKKYRDKEAQNRANAKKYDDLGKELSGIEVASLKADLTSINSDSSKVARVKEWHKSIRKDYYIKETMDVLKDIK